MFDAGGVAYMTQNLMVVSILKLCRRFIEKKELGLGEFVETITVASYKMREYRAWHEGILTLQSFSGTILPLV